MTRAQKSTDLKANVLKVLERIRQRVESPSYDGEAQEWAEALDSMLDRMKGSDQFGTEGQSDPRGDFRDAEWSISEGMEPF